MRGPGVEDQRAVGLRQYLRPARVRQQRRVPGGEEAHRRRSPRLWERSPGQVEQPPSLVVSQRAQLHPLRHRLEPRQRNARPAGRLPQGGRAEGAEVAAQQAGQAFLLSGAGLAEPVFGEAVEVGAAVLPGARGRDADHRQPVPEPGPGDGGNAGRLEQPAQLAGAGRATEESPAQDGGGLLHVRAGDLMTRDAEEPLPPPSGRGGGERPVVRSRDQVDGAAHQRRLHRLAPFQGPGQGSALEGTQAREQSHVARGRVLGLEPGDALQGPGQRHRGALQEQLAGQHRPVQLAGREHALGHGRES